MEYRKIYPEYQLNGKRGIKTDMDNDVFENSDSFLKRIIRGEKL